MAARMKLIFGNETLVTGTTEEHTAEELKDAVYAQFEKFNKMEMELEDGSFAVFGEKVVQGGILIFENVI